MKLGERIKIARKEARLTQERMAELVGVTKGAISQWETGRTEPLGDSLRKIARITGKPVTWLIGLSEAAGFDGAGEGRLLSSLSENFLLIEENTIPVYGQVVAGPNGEIDIHKEQPLFSVTCPEQLCGIKNVYALCVSGNMMAPRYEAGEIIFIDPARRVWQDDYVAVEIRGDNSGRLQVFVGKLLRYNSKELVIRRLNPDLALYFPHSQIISVGLVVMSCIIR